MKRYFYFVPNLHNFGREDVVFVVSVGISQREQTKLALLNEYAKDCGMYLKPRSVTSDLAIDHLKKTLFPNWRFLHSPLKMAYLPISDLYRLIIDGDLNLFTKSIKEPSGSFFFRQMSDPYFLFKQNQGRQAKHTATALRKYLKSYERDEFLRAVINFGLILAVFLLAGWLEGTAQY